MSTRSARKRARIDEDDVADVKPTQTSPVPEPAAEQDRPQEPLVQPPQESDCREKDKEFWFEDGTVIIVAKDVEFRVYAGIIAAHSPVLKELFEKPSD